MNAKALLLLVLFAVVSTSCIPTKDLIYLQGDPAQTAAIQSVPRQAYRLQPNDIIDINIKAIDPELVRVFAPTETLNTMQRSEQSVYFNGFIVDERGNIRMPLLEQVSVIGLTLDETRQRIEKRLLDEHFTEDANIFVVVKLAGFRYTVNGEVQSPGQKILYQDQVNVLEAVASAGDITTVGDRKSVTVIRKTAGRTQVHTLDLTNLSALESPYFHLQPNDYVYVKPLPQKALGTGTTAMQSLSTIITVLSLLTTVTILLTR